MFNLSYEQFKMKAICYTMNVHVLKFYRGCNASEESRSIAMHFSTTELEG